jgi:carbamoylphosphate synthase large subunit
MSSDPSRRLLLLGGVSDPAGNDVLTQTRARGVEVCLVDTPTNLAAARELVAAAAEVMPLDYTDVPACVRWARERSGRQPFLGVYGFREPAVESVAEVAEALGLPGNPVAAVRRVRDKHACRRALADLGFLQPDSALCSGPQEVRAFLAGTGPGPWVIKPSSGWGSAGVCLLRDPSTNCWMADPTLPSGRSGGARRSSSWCRPRAGSPRSMAGTRSGLTHGSSPADSLSAPATGSGR